MALFRNFPPTKGIRCFNVAVFALTPLVATYGLITIEFRRETCIFAMGYYVFSMLGTWKTCS